MNKPKSETIELYLRDLSTLLKEKALEARQQRIATSMQNDDFAIGRLMAYHEVISLMQQQADAFGIDRNELGIGDIEPERDLL